MMKRPLLIFGERCTGTNYIERLVLNNFKHLTLREDLGWKHGYYQPKVIAQSGLIVMVVVRDPFDWIRSLSENPWHVAHDMRQCGFSDFIRAEWKCIWDDHAITNQAIILAGSHAVLPVARNHEMMIERNPLTGDRLENVIKVRVAKYNNWFDLEGKVSAFMLVKYEDAVTNPRQFLDGVEAKCSIKRNFFYKPVRSYKGLGWRKFKPKIYSDISPADHRFIVSQLDLTLEKKFGYEVV